ncbi:hypothetical protein [Spiroplasma culicicola]|uniref:Lipoprotein n=1 Tax=Spiroplasma culicicola AES-1 TaxID=1276246 RepID=W6AGX9_9MOLU|nr:hypothetical protein [Spiroplasma culicicola]AHI52944.1 hypothetical protein SCULI_v1c06030 [Spiroplasma culicicola AES-1]
MLKRILSSTLLIHLFTLPVITIACASPNYKPYEQKFNNYITDKFDKLDEVYNSDQEVINTFVQFSSNFKEFNVGTFDNSCNEQKPTNCIDDKFYSNIESNEIIDRYSKRFLLKFYKVENQHIKNITFSNPSVVVNFGHKLDQGLLNENQFSVSYGNELEIVLNKSNEFSNFQISIEPFDNFNNLIDNQFLKTSISQNGVINILPRKRWNEIAEREKIKFYISATSKAELSKKHGIDFYVIMNGEIQTIELDESTPLESSYPPNIWIKFKIKDPKNQISLNVSENKNLTFRIDQEQKTIEIKFILVKSVKLFFAIRDDNYLYHDLNISVNVFTIEYDFVMINEDIIDIDNSQIVSDVKIKDFKVNSNFLYEGKISIHHNSPLIFDFNLEINVENYKIILKPYKLETNLTEYIIYIQKIGSLRASEINVGDILSFEMIPRNNYFKAFWLKMKFI